MKLQSTNPFQYGVVIDDTAFCNRKEEIAYLKSQINNGYSTWLYSPRRFGKTSLVEKVFRELEDSICIYIDLYNIKSKDDFCRKYSKVIAKELFNWKDDIKRLTKSLSEAFNNLSPTVSFDEFGIPSFSLNIQKVEKQEDIETILEIPYRISSKTSKRVCIAFDEFQEIKRIDPFLLNWMRSSFQRHTNISYIFLGSKQSMMEDIFSSAQSPFYEFAAKMNLSIISRDELFRFIKEKFKIQGIPIESHTVDDILEKSECQPHFTQYFASVVFDLVKAGIDQNSDSFQDSWTGKIIMTQADVFQDIYDQLTNSQRTTLQAVAKLEEPGIFAEDTRIKFGLPVSSSLNEVLKALQKKGLVYKVQDIYKITNPVFKEWLILLN
jgi:AAA+ ATPase superfamily predicted ATPase